MLAICQYNLSVDSVRLIIAELSDLLLTTYLPEDISIFLCGGAGKKQAQTRVQLGRKLSLRRSKYRYSVYFPETLFNDLVMGHSREDLLQLESLLAHSVNCIVIPLESPGTFAELGAFAGHPDLRHKLIVIVHPRFRLASSFINSGPLRSLAKSESSAVLFAEITDRSMTDVAYRVSRVARQIANQVPIDTTLSNPLAAMTFFLAVVYLFDPLQLELFEKLLEIAASVAGSTFSIPAVVSSVQNHRVVRLLRNEMLSLVEDGFSDYLGSRGYNEDQIRDIVDNLSALRARAVNLYYRKRGLYVGGRTYSP